MSPIDFILEVLAVFIGAFLAFFFDSYRDRIAEEKEHFRILHLIRGEVGANLGILQGMIALETSPPPVTYTRTMHDIWDGVGSKLEVIKDDEILRQLTLLYYQFASLDRMLELYEEFAIEYNYRDPVSKENSKTRLDSQRDRYKSMITGLILPQIQKVLHLTWKFKEADEDQVHSDTRIRDKSNELIVSKKA